MSKLRLQLVILLPIQALVGFVQQNKIFRATWHIQTLRGQEKSVPSKAWFLTIKESNASKT